MSVNTGKVLDVKVLTKYCKCNNHEAHDDSCNANYTGSSGGMEVAGVIELFYRSVDMYNVH